MFLFILLFFQAFFHTKLKMRKDRRDKEIQNDQISSERKGIKSEKEYNREQMNKGDMHNTKEIENKNDGIEEKIFTN